MTLSRCPTRDMGRRRAGHRSHLMRACCCSERRLPGCRGRALEHIRTPEFVAFAARKRAASVGSVSDSDRRKTRCSRRRRPPSEPFLVDRSGGRMPRPTPTAAVKSPGAETRAAHPRLEGRKLRHALARQGVVQPPAPSTITTILRRHRLLAPDFLRHATSCASTRRPRALTTRLHGPPPPRSTIPPPDVLNDLSASPSPSLLVPTEGPNSRTPPAARLGALGLPRRLLCDNDCPGAGRREQADGLDIVAARLRHSMSGMAAPTVPRPKNRTLPPHHRRRVFAQRRLPDLPAADRLRPLPRRLQPRPAP